MDKYSTAQESLGYLAKQVPNKVLVNDAALSTTTFLYDLSQGAVAVSLFLTADSGTTTVNVYPVDPAGNVLSSVSLTTAISLTAAGNQFEFAQVFGFRKVQVSVSVGTSATGTLVVYG